MKYFLVATVVACFAAAANASDREKSLKAEVWSPYQEGCVTSVDDQLFELKYYPNDDETLGNSSFREILFSGWGAITCPGEMTIRAMVPDLLPAERKDYCLVFSKKRKTYLGYAKGKKDTYWRCKDSADFQKVDLSSKASFVFPEGQGSDDQSFFRCTARISGKHYRLSYDTNEAELMENLSFRDALFGGDCPGQAVIEALLPELSPIERSAFCLMYDEEGGEYVGYAEGERDAYLKCKEASVPLCDRVNATKEEALAIVGIGAGASAGASAAASAAGVTAVTHSSGAVILTGSSGYIAGTLGTVGSGLLAILSAPVTLTAAAVSVVAVGGAVYVCLPDDNDIE